MSIDDIRSADEEPTRTEIGDEPPDDSAEDAPEDVAPRRTDAPSPVDGISDIRATLDLLERQIVEYRKMLAEQEEAASVDAEPENEATPQLVELDEEQLGSVAESIADQAAAYFAGQVPTEETPEEETKVVAAVELEVAEVVEEPVVAAVEMEVAAVVEVEEVPAEEEGLEAPKVDLPELFAELETQLEMGLHNAASVAVYADGEVLLEYLSAKSGSGVTPTPQPLFRAFSSGKPMAAATVWRLLDAGVLEIDAPVASYWPEFAQRGKGKVTLRHVLTHTAGLPRDFGRGDVDWGDWGRMSDILASMDLEYDPGEVIHYHSITFGILVAEIAARASGIPFVELFEREVKSPLNLVDTSFVIDEEDKESRRRVQPLIAPAGYFDREMPEKMDWLLDNQILSPGASCVTTAGDLARLYATVCNGGSTIEGEVWLSEEAAANVFATHAAAYNIESMSKDRVGQGVWMFDEQPNRTAAPAGSMTFGHGGMATSIAWGDPEYGVSVAIITDTMLDDDLNGRRLNRISAAVRRDLGLPVGSVEEF